MIPEAFGASPNSPYCDRGMVVKLRCAVLRPRQFSTNHLGKRAAPVVAFLLCLVITWGQQSRSVRGTVKDNHGRVLAGAVVQIQDRTTLQIRSYVTQNDGVYHFDGLSPDITYHVRANYAGVSSRTKIFSKFDSETAVVVDLTIHLSR
jgi:hypothetical protein